MAKRGRKKKGEQMPLMDVEPENAKAIITAAREYKAVQVKRMAALEREVDAKGRVLAEIKKAHLQTLDGGVIRFKYDGMLITVKPRDELVQVKEEETE